MKIKTTKEYILTEEEVKTVKTCLHYCLHRLNCHPTAGIQKITNIAKVEAILREANTNRWKGGQEVYHLNGVMFPKELWTKVVNKQLSFKEITEIKDIDQRTQAMAFCDVKDFEKIGTIIDTFEKESLDGGKVTYKLLKIPQGMFTVDAYFAIYNCPSTQKLYMSGIDPEIGKKEDIGLAMAWKQSIKKEEWLLAIPLKHES